MLLKLCGGHVPVDAVPEIQRKADIVSGAGEKGEQSEEDVGGGQRLC